MSANASSSSDVGRSTLDPQHLAELMLLRSRHKQNLTFHSITDTYYDKSSDIDE